MEKSLKLSQRLKSKICPELAGVQFQLVCEEVRRFLSVPQTFRVSCQSLFIYLLSHVSVANLCHCWRAQFWTFRNCCFASLIRQCRNLKMTQLTEWMETSLVFAVFIQMQPKPLLLCPLPLLSFVILCVCVTPAVKSGTYFSF